MTKKLINATAKIIRKCYSPAALEAVARELGTTIPADSDIFHGLIRNGHARDFGHAVEIVAAYLQDENVSDRRTNGLD